MRRYWGVIDNALRTAVVERGVEVKLLTAALHHVPKTLRFLKSLASIDGMHARGSLKVVSCVEKRRQDFLNENHIRKSSKCHQQRTATVYWRESGVHITNSSLLSRRRLSVR